METEGDPFAALPPLDSEVAEMTQEEPVAVPHTEEPAVVSAPRSAAAAVEATSTVLSNTAAPIPSASSPSENTPRVEVSAATVTRMMGIASTADLRLLEGRVDLLTSKVTGLLTKVDRVLSMFGSIPTSSDIGRLEIQIGALKSMLRELLEMSGERNVQRRQPDGKETAEEQARKLKEGIRSSSE